MLHRLTSLPLVGVLVVACSSPNDTVTNDPVPGNPDAPLGPNGPVQPGPGRGPSGGEWQGHPGWEDPPEDSERLTGTSQSDIVYNDGVGYQCTYESYDVTKSFDRVLGLSANHADVKPGMLLQGRAIRNGVFTVIPIARAPLTLSVDAPITNSSRTVDNPTAANIQAAISSLQQDIDREVPPGSLRSNFTHNTQVVSSFQESALFFGLSASFSAPAVQADLSASFESEFRVGTQYFAVKHIEELYTISFSDDVLTTPQDAFADTVTANDLAALEAQGIVGPDNPMVYVKSVTYGRMVLATARAEEQYDSSAFHAAVSAGTTGFQASAEARGAFENLASEASFEVLAIGGSVDEAAAALAGAETDQMFGPATAGGAAPLYYTMRFLDQDRRTAKIGETTSYTTQECTAVSDQPCDNVCGGAYPNSTSLSGLGKMCEATGSRYETFVVEDERGDLTVNKRGEFLLMNQENASREPGDHVEVCWKAQYFDGGIKREGDNAFKVVCPGRDPFQVEAIHVAKPKKGGKPLGERCWLIELTSSSAKCEITPNGPGWTPWGETNRGKAQVEFRLTHRYREPRCFAEDW